MLGAERIRACGVMRWHCKQALEGGAEKEIILGLGADLARGRGERGGIKLVSGRQYCAEESIA